MASPSQIQGDENPIPKVIEKGTPKVKPQLHPISFKSSFLSSWDFHTWWKNIIPRDLFQLFIV